MTPLGRCDGRSAPRRHRPLSEINVTPLVDVMLVLLVVFMITAPMLAAGLKVELPRAATAKPLPPAEPVVVTVGREGRLAVGADPVDRDGLVAAVGSRTGGDVERAVRVRGDREAAYGEVIATIDLLAAAGYGHIALVSLAPSATKDSSDEASAPTVAAASEVRP
ncbi:MAG: biopolymer transporter ExbD [Phyllobacteriaceae bacterium]|nr:biopolymer transporter ExbD [Phyllobacteriaceae bacterium]